MTLNTQYLGPTINVSGASALYSRAYIDVEEQYHTGNSYEGINIGRFEISSIYNTGPRDETLRVSAFNISQKSQYETSILSREYRNNRYNIDIFGSSSGILKTYSFVGTNNWVYSPNELGITLQKGDAHSFVVDQNTQGIKDVIAIGRFGGATNASRLGMVLRLQDNEGASSYSGYFIGIGGSPTNTFSIQSVTDGTYTKLAGVSHSIGPADKNDFWLIATIHKNEIRATIRNGITLSPEQPFYGSFAQVINATDSTFSSGRVAMFAGPPITTTVIPMIIKQFEYAEISDRYSTAEIVTERYAHSGIYDVKIENDVESFDDFTKVGGNSWYYPAGESYLRSYAVQNIGGVSTPSQRLFSSTYDDFVFTFSVRGSSSVGVQPVGFIYGTTDIFWRMELEIDAQSYGGDVRLISGTSSYNFDQRGTHLLFEENKWYDIKVVKRRGYLAMYTNGKLYCHYLGVTINSDYHHIGIEHNGVSGTTADFKNPRLSKLDLQPEDTYFDSGNPINSQISRLIPETFTTISSGSDLSIFTYGSSRGRMNISNDNYIDTSLKSIDRVGTYQNVGIRSTAVAAISYDRTPEVVDQLHGYRIRNLSTQTVTTQTDAESYLEDTLDQINATADQIDITSPAIPHLELFDEVNYSDTILGVSRLYKVKTFSKSFNAERGSFTQTTTLVRK